MSTSDLDAIRAIQPALEPGEELLWAGRPVHWLPRSGEIVSVGISILSGGLMTGEAIRNLGETWPPQFSEVTLFLYTFLAISLIAMIVYPASVVCKNRRRVYAVTDRRLLAIVRGCKRQNVAESYEMLQKVNCRAYHDGTGRLSFIGLGRWVDTIDSEGNCKYVGGVDYANIAFLDIAEPRAVSELIAAQMSAHPTHPVERPFCK